MSENLPVIDAAQFEAMAALGNQRIGPCTVLGDVRIDTATILSADWSDCIFIGDVSLRRVDVFGIDLSLKRAKIHGSLELTGVLARGRLQLDHIDVTGSIRIESLVVDPTSYPETKGRVSEWTWVSFAYAKVSGSVLVTDVYCTTGFGVGISLFQSSIAGDVCFRECFLTKDCELDAFDLKQVVLNSLRRQHLEANESMSPTLLAQRLFGHVGNQAFPLRGGFGQVGAEPKGIYASGAQVGGRLLVTGSIMSAVDFSGMKSRKITLSSSAITHGANLCSVSADEIGFLEIGDESGLSFSSWLYRYALIASRRAKLAFSENARRILSPYRTRPDKDKDPVERVSEWRARAGKTQDGEALLKRLAEAYISNNQELGPIFKEILWAKAAKSHDEERLVGGVNIDPAAPCSEPYPFERILFSIEASDRINEIAWLRKRCDWLSASIQRVEVKVVALEGELKAERFEVLASDTLAESEGHERRVAILKQSLRRRVSRLETLREVARKRRLRLSEIQDLAFNAVTLLLEDWRAKAINEARDQSGRQGPKGSKPSLREECAFVAEKRLFGTTYLGGPAEDEIAVLKRNHSRLLLNGGFREDSLLDESSYGLGLPTASTSEFERFGERKHLFRIFADSFSDFFGPTWPLHAFARSFRVECLFSVPRSKVNRSWAEEGSQVHKRALAPVPGLCLVHDLDISYLHAHRVNLENCILSPVAWGRSPPSPPKPLLASGVSVDADLVMPNSTFFGFAKGSVVADLSRSRIGMVSFGSGAEAVQKEPPKPIDFRFAEVKSWCGLGVESNPDDFFKVLKCSPREQIRFLREVERAYLDVGDTEAAAVVYRRWRKERLDASWASASFPSPGLIVQWLHGILFGFGTRLGGFAAGLFVAYLLSVAMIFSTWHRVEMSVESVAQIAEATGRDYSEIQQAISELREHAEQDQKHAGQDQRSLDQLCVDWRRAICGLDPQLKDEPKRLADAFLISARFHLPMLGLDYASGVRIGSSSLVYWLELMRIVNWIFIPLVIAVAIGRVIPKKIFG